MENIKLRKYLNRIGNEKISTIMKINIKIPLDKLSKESFFVLFAISKVIKVIIVNTPIKTIIKNNATPAISPIPSAFATKGANKNITNNKNIRYLNTIIFTLLCLFIFAFDFLQ